MIIPARPPPRASSLPTRSYSNACPVTRAWYPTPGPAIATVTYTLSVALVPCHISAPAVCTYDVERLFTNLPIRGSSTGAHPDAEHPRDQQQGPAGAMASPEAALNLDSLCPRGAQAAKCVVSRLMHLGKCIGTAVRVAWAAGDEPMGDIVLTARHCVEEGGACLSGLCAFDGDLAFLAARPDLDVAVFRGPRGRGLRLMQHALLPGGDIWLLSFPLPVELEFAATSAAAAGAGGAAAATAATADEVPTVDRGTVSRIGPTGLSAVASFNTGMRDSSGGAVLCGPCALAGLYTCLLWHLQGLVDAVDAAAGDVGKAAELSWINIPHKSCASMFTTATALWQLLQQVVAAPDQPGPSARPMLWQTVSILPPEAALRHGPSSLPVHSPPLMLG
eukprot:XP_001689660.1 predicted protein [Chlamydomonas reinhardtii]